MENEVLRVKYVISNRLNQLQFLLIFYISTSYSYRQVSTSKDFT